MSESALKTIQDRYASLEIREDDYAEISSTRWAAQRFLRSAQTLSQRTSILNLLGAKWLGSEDAPPPSQAVRNFCDFVAGVLGLKIPHLGCD